MAAASAPRYYPIFKTASASLPSASLPSASLPSASLPSASLPSASLPSASLPSASLPSSSASAPSLPLYPLFRKKTEKTEMAATAAAETPKPVIATLPAIGFHCGAGDGPKGTKLVPFLTTLRTLLPLTAAQIFISSPTSFAHCAWHPSTCKAIHTHVTAHKIRLFVHAPYIINPCTDDTSVIHGLLVNLLHSAATMGAEGVVIHVGKSLKLGEPEGLRRMRVFIDGVLGATAASGKPAARLLIETCAGQGTEVARDLKVFGAFVKEVVAAHGVDRVGACVDTCHVFACGYRIGSLAETVGAVIGWENVHLIHLNDSKTECGKRVDRHECIGHGKIGKAELGAFCYDVAAAAPHAAFVFETPDVDDDGATRTAEFAWFHSLFPAAATASL